MAYRATSSDLAMTLQRHPPSSLFLFHLLAPLLWYICGRSVDAALSSPILQAINCSTSGNYTTSSAYAANVNQFLAVLTENAVSKNGGFFNGSVGDGLDVVYGLAMCPADYSRADCSNCLTAASGSNADGLPNRCPGSTTVLAMFDRCLLRYSNVDFFGTPEIGVVQALGGDMVRTSATYGQTVAQILKATTDEAIISPQRFAASAGAPYVFVQCTWDLRTDKCKQCLDVLSANATNIFAIRTEGQRKSYSCTVRYSNTSYMVVPFTAAAAAASAPPPQPVDQTGTSSAAHPSSTGGSKAATVGGAVAAVLVVVVICLAASIWRVYKLRRQHNTKDVRRFYYPELVTATSNFTEEVGAGGFGTVYKGKVKGIPGHVAVKKIKIPKVTTSQQGTVDPEQVRRDVEQVRIDFDNEIEVMSPLHHRNIIRLVGWCKDNNNLFLVYELMENGNLDDQLHSKAGAMDSDLHGVTVPGTTLLLDWQKRNNILIGVATGLVYLHCECGERLLHRDIKPSNVMLDKTFNAKLCDFGLVTQFSHNQTSRSTDNIRGTRGYVDPAYADNGRACEQNDIYSLGIVLLEVVCCERPTVTLVGDGLRNNLIEKVRTCYYQGNGGILGAADKRLRGPFDEQLRRVLMVGLSCVQPDRHRRPHIRRVLECLTSQTAPLPLLPTENYTLPRVNETGSAASTARSSDATEDGYSTCPIVLRAQSGTVDDIGSTPFLSGQ